MKILLCIITIIEAAWSIIWPMLETNFVSSVLGGFLAALIFWKFFEQRIKNLLEYSEKKKAGERFRNEILYNRMVASRTVAKRNEYLSSTKFTFLKYKTDCIDAFVKLKPLNLDGAFYSRVQILFSAGFSKDNMLLDIFWFAPEATDEDRQDYKQKFIDNAKNNVSNIDKILKNERFLSEMQGLGLLDISEETQPE